MDDLGGDEVEVPLSGGAQTAGVVRVGATVRIPALPRSVFIHKLLRHLEVAGFDGAPRAPGLRRAGSVLSLVEGEVVHSPPYGLSDAQLLSATGLIRRYHDTTASSSLCGDQEVVCHSDLSPHNMVFRGERAVGIIDWDDGVARFVRARAQHDRAGRVRAVEIFDGLITWMDTHGQQIESKHPRLGLTMQHQDGRQHRKDAEPAANPRGCSSPWWCRVRSAALPRD